MSDLVEVLIIDHLTIKHAGEIFNPDLEIGDFMNFHSYLKECHMEIEEKILFPTLKKGRWGDERWFFTKIDQLISDHRLIDSMVQNVVSWYRSGDMGMVIEHLPLYFKILVDHNNSEESYIFGRWKMISDDERLSAMNEARVVIKNFGLKRYLGVTGLSEGAFMYMFSDAPAIEKQVA